jgi:dihydroorotate dehydrogenase electron transfer subunit
MTEYEAGIIQSEYRGNNTYFIRLACEEISKQANPGQFIQIRTGNGTDPFLRRTFSMCGSDSLNGEISVLIETIGQGTDLICGNKRGNPINIIGPLGNGFDINPAEKGFSLLVGGGIGGAPLLFLSEKLKTSGNKFGFLLGGKTKEAVDVYKGMFSDISYATDDGSYGFHGFVTELLEMKIKEKKPVFIYSCGPAAMMKKVSSISEKYGIECQVSLEEKMACGIGACYGCVVELANGNMARICREGPVFKSTEVYTVEK